MAEKAAEKPWASVVPRLTEKCMKDAAVLILQGKNMRTTYKNGETVRNDEPEEVYMPFIVKTRDDLFHAETVRKIKGYGIVGIEHLDNLAKAKPAEAKIIAERLALITRSPEADRKLADAHAMIAELEAQIAALQAKPARGATPAPAAPAAPGATPAPAADKADK